MILTGGRILTFDDQQRVIDSGSVEVRADGSIGAVRTGRSRSAEAVDLKGRLVMPALINGHAHLYGTMARGMPLDGPPAANFPQILERLWWRLDRALHMEDVYYSALVGLIDSAKAGVGTLIDHHASPNACAGSLDVIERAFREVGLRGATCYEVSDRNGPQVAAQGIAENVRFLERGAMWGMFGLHAAFTLSDRTLAACREANATLGAGFHVHVAEDRCDVGAARRLCEAGVLDQRSIAAHCVHVTAAERGLLARRGVNVVTNPQSNCNNRVGTADTVRMMRRGVLVGLGSDGYTPRMWEEWKTACHVQKLAVGEAYAMAFLNNRQIVKKIWGVELGRVATGARADLAIYDYQPPTPLDAGNVFGHLLFGIAQAPLYALMVDGRWVVREGQCVNVDERRIAAGARKRAKLLWEKV